MDKWADQWRAYEPTTSDVKQIFPELEDFRKYMWKTGCWHWMTTSMVLGRLPVNGSYVGMCNDDIESDICDCGFDDAETISHFIFECPRYSHLRLGWRWSQVGDPKLRYK